MSIIWVTTKIATSIATNTGKLTAAPSEAAHTYFTVSASTTPIMPPIIGPTYGITLNMPVMKAMPMEYLKPSLAMMNMPRKFTRATPSTSQKSPVK